MPDVGALNTSSMAAHGSLPQNRISMCENSVDIFSDVFWSGFLVFDSWNRVCSSDFDFFAHDLGTLDRHVRNCSNWRGPEKTRRDEIHIPCCIHWILTQTETTKKPTKLPGSAGSNGPEAIGVFAQWQAWVFYGTGGFLGGGNSKIVGIFTPDPYREMIQFDEQIFFQMGCNHQLRSVAVGISLQ